MSLVGLPDPLIYPICNRWLLSVLSTLSICLTTPGKGVSRKHFLGAQDLPDGARTTAIADPGGNPGEVEAERAGGQSPGTRG